MTVANDVYELLRGSRVVAEAITRLQSAHDGGGQNLRRAE